jgi:hypothetical protein
MRFPYAARAELMSIGVMSSYVSRSLDKTAAARSDLAPTAADDLVVAALATCDPAISSTETVTPTAVALRITVSTLWSTFALAYRADGFASGGKTIPCCP